MAWTKRDLVLEAFGEIGMNANIFNVTPTDLEGALRRLDFLMAGWNAKGIRLGYAMPSGADTGSLDDDSGLPDAALETVVCSLAIRIAPGYGKQLTQTTLAVAKSGYDTLLADAARPLPMGVPAGMPRGAGSKPWRWAGGNFTTAPAEPLLAGPDGPIEFN